MRSQQNLAEAREKLGQEMHQLRLDDAVLWKDTEQIARELALFKIGCSVEERTEVLQITEVFRGKTVDISGATLTIEAPGTTEKMNALEALLSKFDLKEMVRTGKVVMARGAEPT